ncbi:MAG: hypothetical protein ACKOEU_08205 [Limnohabitans sp.]
MNTTGEPQDQAKPATVDPGTPNIWDILFLLLLAFALVCVAWVGVLSHEEGTKNEITKQNGEAWVKWLKDNSEPRMQEDFAIESCATSAMERRRWGDCYNDILENVKEIKVLKNAFTGESLTFIAKCDPKDRSTIGNISLEKIVPTPPGSAVPTVASQLVDIDAIDTKIALKVTVCDKGGYPIKVDEFEF